MTSGDVRSILNLAGSSSTTAPRRPANLIKRPEGISRELYALIGDNAPSLAEAQASVAAVKYRERPKAKARNVKWSVASVTVRSLLLGNGRRSTLGRGKTIRCR